MKRYYEFTDEQSSKFWEVEVREEIVITRWGKTGSKGQSKEKAFATNKIALAEAAKQSKAKINKGYTDTSNSGTLTTQETSALIAAPTPVRKVAKTKKPGKAPIPPKTSTDNSALINIPINSPIPRKASVKKPTENEVREEYLRLIDEVNAHNERYYKNSAPTISDPEWDQLFRRLLVIERDFPGLKVGDTPTGKVGGDIVLDGFEKHTHEVAMLSLDNAFNVDELKAFFDRIEDSQSMIFCAEPKMDGFACSLIYEHGELTVAATRGNKIVGENITENVKTIPDIPTFISIENLPERFEVRGEIYMGYAVFDDLNTAMEQQGKERYKNPRNAASGAIGNLDTSVTRSRKLQFMAYSCHSLSDEEHLLPSSHYDRLQWLLTAGIPIDAHSKKIVFTQFDDVVEEFTNLRPKLPYGIDGIVFKADDVNLHDTIGYSSRSPKWAIAYKYPAEEKETLLKDVIWQVGRSGTLSPVAIVEPVDLDGATVSRATLHNLEDIIRKDLMIGDTVVILRSGDVIPMIKGPNLDLRPTNAKAITQPSKCPSCGGTVEELPGDHTGHRCANDLSCPAQLSRRVIHFASKKCLDIEWLGDSAIIEACSIGLVTKPADLYDITATQLLEQLTGFKAKKAKKIVSSIQQSKTNSLARFLRSFGINEIGSTLSQKLAIEFQSIEAMKEASFEELLAIDDIGGTTAGYIVDFFETRWGEVEELLAKGFTLSVPSVIKDSAITGLSFVVTGSFTGKYSRKEIEASLKSHGAKVSGSISKNTYALLYGDKAGSKLDKAAIINGDNPGTVILFNEEESVQLIDKL